MRPHSRMFRLATGVAISALAAGQLAPGVAWAQGALPPLPSTQGGQAAGQSQAVVNVPERVGTLSKMTGTVSFHAAGQTEWSPATLNYPVASGSSFWTQPQASAELDIGGAMLVMGETTEVDVTTLTQTAADLSLDQGEMYVHVRYLGNGESYQVATPRGVVTIGQVGQYGIVSGTTASPTLVTVISGAASINTGTATLTVAANQTASITGSPNFTGQVGAAQTDAFLQAQLAADITATASVQLPPAVQQMSGCSALVGTGQWSQTSEYGQVWYPPVAADWVPYREGHWAYVEPWGWTWVSTESWGFAPDHYGRWVEIGNRWGWTPLAVGAPVDVAPVYAPALVGFVGLAAGVAIGAALAHGVGWVPLGPNEPYRPWFNASPNYIRAVNVTSVRNFTTINNYHYDTVNNFANRRALTVVDPSVMARSQPVAQHVSHVDPQSFAAARATSAIPVRPTAETVGVTPAVARSLHIATPAGGFPTAHAAPGPVIRADAPRAGFEQGRGGAPGPAIINRGPAGALAQARPDEHGGAPGPAIAPERGPENGARPALPAPNAAAAAHEEHPAPGPVAAEHGAPAAAAREEDHAAAPHVEAPRAETPTAHAPEAHDAARPAPETHEAARPAPEVHEAARPAPEVHEAARPAPEVHEAARPAPEVHEAARPAPAVHEAPRAPEAHAAPARPAPHVAERPAPVHVAEARPAPRPAPRPAARPAEHEEHR